MKRKFLIICLFVLSLQIVKSQNKIDTLNLRTTIQTASQILINSVFTDINRNNFARGFLIPPERPLVICLSLNDCSFPSSLVNSGINGSTSSKNELNSNSIIDNMNITSNIVYEASIETVYLDNNLNPITTLSSGQNGFPETNGFINLIIGGSLKVKSNFTINNNTISLENGSMTISNFNKPVHFSTGTVCKYNGIAFTYSNGKWKEMENQVTSNGNTPANSNTKRTVIGTIEDLLIGLPGDKCRIIIKEYPNELFNLYTPDAIKYGLLKKEDGVLRRTFKVGMKVKINLQDSWVILFEKSDI